MVFANISVYNERAETYLLDSNNHHADIVLFAETHIPQGQRCATAAQKLEQAGRKASFATALPSPDADSGNLGGALAAFPLGARFGLLEGSTPSTPHVSDASQSMLTGAMALGPSHDLLILGGYLRDGLDASSAHTSNFVREVRRRTSDGRRPFILLLDANCTPQQCSDSGLFDCLASAAIVPPSDCTCTCSVGPKE